MVLKPSTRLHSGKQLKITDFTHDKLIHYTYLPTLKKYKSNKGLSERQIKRRLEKQGWLVWRGSALNILKRPEVYPNVRRKYTLLFQLLHKHNKDIQFLQYLCHQAGMPDFLCYKHNHFKFIECKFKNEQLSKRQKRCIQRLQAAGFQVEVIKFTDHKIRTRKKIENQALKTHLILEKQKAIV